MSRFDIEKAREFLRNRERVRSEELKKKWQAARADFDSIVQMIVRRYDPERVYQWGSLLNAAHFSEISDIDIAVEGVASAQDFLRLYEEAAEMTDYPLDVVELEKIEPEFRDIILEHGRLVYERE